MRLQHSAQHIESLINGIIMIIMYKEFYKYSFSLDQQFHVKEFTLQKLSVRGTKIYVHGYSSPRYL